MTDLTAEISFGLVLFLAAFLAAAVSLRMERFIQGVNRGGAAHHVNDVCHVNFLLEATFVMTLRRSPRYH